MELNADEPGMVGALDDLGQLAVGRDAGEQQAVLFEELPIVHVHFVAVAMALGDMGSAIDVGHAAAPRQLGGIGAQPHGAAQVALSGARLGVVALDPLGHHANHRLAGRTEFGGGGVLDTGSVAGGFDAGHLHAETDAEIGHVLDAGEARRLDLAGRTTLAEPAGDQYAMHMLEIGRWIVALEYLGIDPLQVDLDLVGDAAMDQGFRERLIGVLEAGIFAHDGDVDLAFGAVHAGRDLLPGRKIGRRRIGDAEGSEDLGIQPFLVVGQRDVIDRTDVQPLDHGAFTHVAEEAQLLLFPLGDRPVAAHQQHIGRNADGAQLLDRMLGRLGLELAGRGNVGHQGQMQIAGVVARQIVAELANGLEEGQTLDIAHRAADLDQDEIEFLIAFHDECLDGVGDVGNDLDGGAQILAPAFLGENVRIEPASGDVVAFVGSAAGEALVVAKVQIGLGPVIGDEDLAMLGGRHGARIDVEIGVELPQADFVAARLQHGAERRRCKTLAQ